MHFPGTNNNFKMILSWSQSLGSLFGCPSIAQPEVWAGKEKTPNPNPNLFEA